MNLVKLSDTDVYKVIKGKKIICVERSRKYLEELCSRYDVLDYIAAIAEENLHNQKPLQLKVREIPVYALQYIEHYDLSKVILLITSDYYREYYDKLVRLLKGNSSVDTIYFFANKETEYELFYREKYANAPLENIIVFRSGPHADAYVNGMDFSDNARALFEYALSIKLNEKYELVWLVKSPEKFKEYQKYRNVSFLSFDSSVSENTVIRDCYYRVLCLAKYFFFTDAYGFVRNCRMDQIRVQLWHGCGYKKRLNAVSCEKRYDYMTVTSPLYARLHAKEFGLRDEQMLVTGCAKTDLLFDIAPEIWDKLPIPAAERYIFWMPTYRFSEEKMNKPIDGKLNKETGLPLVSCMQELETINEKLKKNNSVLVIKIHPFQDRKSIHVKEFSNIILLENDFLAENNIQINQILGMADALISDYSSTAVDYLVLNRHMAFCVEDIDDYLDQRGYIFENILEWLPGKVIYDVTGLLEFIDEIGNRQDTVKEKRSFLRKKMHKYHDNNSCRRILKVLGILD